MCYVELKMQIITQTEGNFFIIKDGGGGGGECFNELLVYENCDKELEC